MRDDGRTKVIKDLGSGQEHGATPATMTGECVVKLLVAPPCSGYIAGVVRCVCWDKGAGQMTTAQRVTRFFALAPNNNHGRPGHSREYDGEHPASSNLNVFVAPNRYSIVAVRTCTLLQAQS